jgi:tryptophanyl-tRNA synthetase
LRSLKKKFQEAGDELALAKYQGFVGARAEFSADERALLVSDATGKGRAVLVEPEVLLSPVSKLLGLDGRKMSKSYGNGIAMRESPESVTQKIRTMPTDPARVKRTDPGNPERCPVWHFHQVYSPTDTQTWVQTECRRAGIGCLECKQPVISAVLAEQQPMLERAKPYMDRPDTVKDIVSAGCMRAKVVADDTMQQVRSAIGLNY